MSIYKSHQGYEHLEHDVESGELSVNNTTQYNYVPHHGYFFPGSGLNYVIGIDGHRSLVQQKKLTKPTAFVGVLFCPCFAAEEPFSDESKLRYRNCLSSFTFIISLAQIILLGFLLKDGLAPIRENPSVGPTVTTLVKFGAKTVLAEQSQMWRLLSSTFLYAGVLHAVFNLAIQFRLGMYLEREWGWPLFLITYLLSGLGGNLLSCILEPSLVGVGSSGAVAGLVAAYGVQVALCYRTFDTFQRRLQVFQFVTFFAMILILILCPFVNWSNVLGGCFIGALLGFAIWDREERRYFWIIPTLLLLTSFAGAICYLFLTLH
jgi:membrane associated rhomboid family serine protease